MTEQQSTFDQKHYNQIAIQTAERISAVRDNKPPASPKKRDIENLFPSFNRTGLGVALEYQNMGNQPVTDALQEKANALGATFEHLGLTLGTVIHDVDLTQLTPELIAFTRKALLERKVIFFRNQNLTEDQQVKFGQGFGELDAFPFGKPGHNPYILQIIHDENRPGNRKRMAH